MTWRPRWSLFSNCWMLWDVSINTWPFHFSWTSELTKDIVAPVVTRIRSRNRETNSWSVRMDSSLNINELSDCRKVTWTIPILLCCLSQSTGEVGQIWFRCHSESRLVAINNVRRSVLKKKKGEWGGHTARDNVYNLNDRRLSITTYRRNRRSSWIKVGALKIDSGRVAA